MKMLRSFPRILVCLVILAALLIAGGTALADDPATPSDLQGGIQFTVSSTILECGKIGQDATTQAPIFYVQPLSWYFHVPEAVALKIDANIVYGDNSTGYEYFGETDGNTFTGETTFGGPGTYTLQGYAKYTVNGSWLAIGDPIVVTGRNWGAPPLNVKIDPVQSINDVLRVRVLVPEEVPDTFLGNCQIIVAPEGSVQGDPPTCYIYHDLTQSTSDLDGNINGWIDIGEGLGSYYYNNRELIAVIYGNNLDANTRYVARVNHIRPPVNDQQQRFDATPVTVTMVNSDIVKLRVLNVPVTNEAVFGSFCYDVQLTLPATANGNFQWGWSGDKDAQAPDVWEDATLSWFNPVDGDPNSARFTTLAPESGVYDVLFVRLNAADQNVKKIVFYYNTVIDNSIAQLAAPTIENNITPELLKSFTVNWTAVDDAAYRVFWKTPFETNQFTRGENFISTEMYGGVENMIAWAGEYEVWVIPMVNGRRGPESGHLTFSVEEPDASDSIQMFIDDGFSSNDQGALTGQLNRNIHFRFVAPGARDIRFFCGNRFEYFGFDDRGEANWDWMATEADQAGKTFQFYAQARFEDEHGELYSITSNLERITIDGYNQADVISAEDVNWSIQGNPGSVARDSILTINVQPVEGAEYVSAFITHNGDWVTECRWMPAGEDGTILSLPMLACEPNESYQIHVYAAKIGVPRKYSEVVRTIQVTDPAGEGNILFAMKNSYVTCEPIQLRALYTDPNNLQNAWMQIRIYNLNDPNDRPYDQGRGFEFRDDGFSIDHAGSYRLVATILQDAGEGNEPTFIDDAAFDFEVTSNGSLSNILLYGIPALHPGNTDLTFRYDSNTNAEQYDVTLHYCPDGEDWEELGSYHYLATANDPQIFERTFDKSLFSKNGAIREGRYRIWVHASAYDMNSTWNEQYFYVTSSIPETATVTLVAEDFNGNQATAQQLGHWPSSKHMEFRLYAPDTALAQVQAVRFLNFDGCWECRDGCNQDGGWFSWGDGPGRGTYSVVAQVSYTPVKVFNGHTFREMTEEEHNHFNWDEFNWETAGFEWTAVSNEIQVTVYSEGEMKAAKYTLNKNTVVRGENFVVTIGELQLQNQDEWYGARIVELDGWEHEYWSWDEQTKTIVIPTADFQAGEYRLLVWADAEGIEGKATYAEVTITEPESGIVFNVYPAADNEGIVDVVLGQELTASIYAPGARHVGFRLDDDRWDLDEENNDQYTWGEWPCWHDRFSIDDAGEHTLQAYAFYQDENGENSRWTAGPTVTVNVTSLGRVEPFDLTTLPAAFTVGNAQSLTISLPGVYLFEPLPENEQYPVTMRIGVYEDWDDNDGYHRVTIFPNRELFDDVTVNVPAANLNAGHRIVIDMNAWAYGCEGTGRSISIPIVAAPGNGAELSMVAGDIWTDEQTNEKYVLVDGDAKFLVTPTSGNTLSAVRFFDGDGFWEWGDAITPQNHPEWFEDGKFFAWCYFHDTERIHAVYAEVKLNDSEEWITTNVIPVVLKVNGSVGEYDFANTSAVTVSRGETVDFTFSAATGAYRYWVDAFDKDDQSYNPQTIYNERTVTMSTANLPAGTYEIRGRAGADPGIQWRESTSSVQLTVTEPVNLPEGSILLSFNKNSVETLESFIISVYAPGAERIRLCHNDPDNEWWNWEGESCTDRNWMADVGVQTFYVSAMYNGEWSDPQTATITVTGEGQTPIATVAYASASINPGDDFLFHVEMPDGADVYSVWANKNGNDNASVLDWSERDHSDSFTIHTAGMADGESFHVTVRTSARGKMSTHFDLDVQVAATVVMENVTFTTPASLQTIEEEAFYGIGAEVIRISDSVTTIGDRAFAYSSVRQIYIPSSVTSMSGSAFEGCENVTIFSTEDENGYSYPQLWVIDHPDAPCKGVILSN